MQNPFEEIDKRLMRLEMAIRKQNKSQEKEKRIVTLHEFANYSGYATSTLYIKLSQGEKVPGAFKPKGSKRWYFDLDRWDQYLEAAMSEQL